MKQKGFIQLLIFSVLLLLVGCNDDDSKTTKEPNPTPKSNEQSSDAPPQKEKQPKKQVAALPLIKAAEAKRKQSKGATISVMGTQTLSLKDETNSAVNQINLEGKESLSSHVTYLKGTLNQQISSEFYFDEQMIYEKNKQWSKRPVTSYRRNPADSVYMMNKLMNELSQLEKENGLRGEKQGNILQIGVDKAAFQGMSIEQELKTAQQKAIEREVHSQNPKQQVSAVNIDDLQLQITISDKTKEYTQITIRMTISYKIDNQTFVVDEELTKSLTGSLNTPISIPSAVKNAPKGT